MNVSKNLILNFFKDTNIDLTIYSNNQLKIIEKGIDYNLTKNQITSYLDHKLTYRQMNEIFLGLIGDIDVSLYAYRKYRHHQMKQIRLGLEKKIDVSLYLNPLFSDIQMQEIRTGLMINKQRTELNSNLNLIDVESYAKIDINYNEMRKIRTGKL